MNAKTRATLALLKKRMQALRFEEQGLTATKEVKAALDAEFFAAIGEQGPIDQACLVRVAKLIGEVNKLDFSGCQQRIADIQRFSSWLEQGSRIERPSRPEGSSMIHFSLHSLRRTGLEFTVEEGVQLLIRDLHEKLPNIAITSSHFDYAAVLLQKEMK